MLFLRNGDIAEADSDTAAGGVFVAESLYAVRNFACDRGAVFAEAVVDNIAEILLYNKFINLKLEHIVRSLALYITEILRYCVVEDAPAD